MKVSPFVRSPMSEKDDVLSGTRVRGQGARVGGLPVPSDVCPDFGPQRLGVGADGPRECDDSGSVSGHGRAAGWHGEVSRDRSRRPRVVSSDTLKSLPFFLFRVTLSLLESTQILKDDVVSDTVRQSRFIGQRSLLFNLKFVLDVSSTATYRSLPLAFVPTRSGSRA